MKKVIYKLFKLIGYRVISNSVDSQRQLEINNLKKENEKFKFLLSDNISKKIELFNYYDSSKSQICQDWFVLESLNYKKNGYFVEVGAASGVNLSNTFLLEKNMIGMVFCQSLLQAGKNHLKSIEVVKKTSDVFTVSLEKK